MLMFRSLAPEQSFVWVALLMVLWLCLVPCVFSVVKLHKECTIWVGVFTNGIRCVSLYNYTDYTIIS